ncbi:MAG TPA: helix-turn-helix domain-containing protein [Cyanobacteria bacterium UBA11149]|nr:helix-turn-helix domain-containing protein [Cyanobacteria bacterium UBA11367]HBE59057.1 helix-turn-helix domain-containing protein [Cyanobacteria bacterium UBA11366]HBK63631.1 helix-turn-helix domain-containing protein [Cyanobacteria bacterium UBA11166]HBR72295.1 helix-turn-helix domain-containing protein [Cyanobacteria bacterium UBA11159]HBS71895.1 helix-turn-helix domain-containing protein [Cyanobacteria bacterium UBA11153]HBW90321.1 helix-turn-helix domain-containing protein [Cyanobacter
MPGIVKINITESTETLKHLLSQQKQRQSFERIQALYLLKTGQVKTVQNLVIIIGRHRTTIQAWLRRYRQGGISYMLEIGKSSGRPSVVPDWAIERLSEELNSSKAFSSYGEVQNWLAEELGVKVNYDVVHKLVRYKLKYKLNLSRHKNTV